MEIRDARPEEYAAIAEMTVAAYLAVGVAPDAPYMAELRDAEHRAKNAELVVAVDGGRLVGSVTFAPFGSEYAELARPGEAEFRMLVAAPAEQGRGIGAALVAECLRRARVIRAPTLRLSTAPSMHAAHRLYDRLGFHRVPELDWEPIPGIILRSYAAPTAFCAHCGSPLITGDHAPCRTALTEGPPDWCPWCRTPTPCPAHHAT